MCRAQLAGVKCTRASCCSTVGAAWGVPCQRCPANRACKVGMYKHPGTGKCTDINECRGIPNICAMGTCVNTIGSYRCECGAGRIYSPYKFECSGRCLDFIDFIIFTLLIKCRFHILFNWDKAFVLVLTSLKLANKTSSPLTFTPSLVLDWNECKSPAYPNLCEFGKCINLEGSFKCECV